jgi:hypothetical protein
MRQKLLPIRPHRLHLQGLPERQHAYKHRAIARNQLGSRIGIPLQFIPQLMQRELSDLVNNVSSFKQSAGGLVSPIVNAQSSMPRILHARVKRGADTLSVVRKSLGPLFALRVVIPRAMRTTIEDLRQKQVNLRRAAWRCQERYGCFKKAGVWLFRLDRMWRQVPENAIEGAGQKTGLFKRDSLLFSFDNYLIYSGVWPVIKRTGNRT